MALIRFSGWACDAMIVTGTIYGVVLNDSEERAALGDALKADPYKALPLAPVVYIKPRLCATSGGAAIPLPQGEGELVAASTVALLFGRDATGVTPEAALSYVDAACLALEVSLPSGSYYRPAVAERCRDGFLPLAAADGVRLPDEIVTLVDGVEVHRWSLARLVRSPAQLISDLSAFMTLRAGDLLMIGLPGDAPRVTAGQTIRIEADGLLPLATTVAADAVREAA
jgi:5-oxopent-3-ene-1,2,5-tricarboxylate decarboxylase / 2-hydroxyhepta-2,4-diene-1,7-dioate isomerase